MRYLRSRLSAPLFSYSRQTIPDDGIESRKLQTTLSKEFAEVELGLVALDRVKGETPTPKSPIERMHHHHHHKVPGVSIAVINNEKIDWSPGYGLADAATGQTVEIGTRFQAACLWRIVISPSHMACNIVTSLFFVLLISQALLIVARHRALPGEFSVLYVGWQL